MPSFSALEKTAADFQFFASRHGLLLSAKGN
jgi:hypothetical protein